MQKMNKLARTICRLDPLPALIRRRLITLVMGKMIPFVRTSHLLIEEMTSSRVVASIPNRKDVQNHIGGVHAAAMALLAETATGFVVAMNVPDTHLPLMKSLKVNYKKRLKGSLRVEAWLDEDQKKRVLTEEKGDVLVQMRATDDSGQEPIECEMIWAWTPKKR